MDEVLLSKIRLSVVTELIIADRLTFSELQSALEVTNGNLSAHLARLVAEKYIDEKKQFIGRRPSTRYRLTSKGRDALLTHVAWLNRIVGDSARKK